MRKENRENKTISIVPGKIISAAFYESICLYPRNDKILSFLEDICSERYFKVIIAEIFTDILASGNFIALIDPLVLEKDEWSVLFDYLGQGPEQFPNHVLLSKPTNLKIPKHLTKCFKTTDDKREIEQLILYCNKKAVNRMLRKRRQDFIEKRRQDVQMILGRSESERQFLIRKFAKYYNVSIRTIKRDFDQVS